MSESARPATTPATTDLAGLFDLHGRVAVVTGAARGIGRAATEALAAAGAYVIAVDRRPDTLTDAAAACRAAGLRVDPVTVDVTSADDRARILHAVDAAGQPAEVVVTAAGIMRRTDPLGLSTDTLTELIRTNVEGTVAVVQDLLPGMVEAGYGKVVTVGSLGSVRGLDRRTGYATTKGAVAAYTTSLASELGCHGIRANTLAPGYISTDMASEYIYANPDHTEKLRARIPLGAFAAPGDLAGTFVFLAAPASDYITGQVIVIDGGWTTR